MIEDALGFRRDGLPPEVASELSRRDKIILGLIDRGEQGMDTQGSDDSCFQASFLLG